MLHCAFQSYWWLVADTFHAIEHLNALLAMVEVKGNIVVQSTLKVIVLVRVVVNVIVIIKLQVRQIQIVIMPVISVVIVLLITSSCHVPFRPPR